jgi:hypothetical protein
MERTRAGPQSGSKMQKIAPAGASLDIAGSFGFGCTQYTGSNVKTWINEKERGSLRTVQHVYQQEYHESSAYKDMRRVRHIRTGK